MAENKTSKLLNLPSFFQNAPATVLSELADFELGGLEDEALEGMEETPLEEDDPINQELEDVIFEETVENEVSPAFEEAEETSRELHAHPESQTFDVYSADRLDPLVRAMQLQSTLAATATPPMSASQTFPVPPIMPHHPNHPSTLAAHPPLPPLFQGPASHLPPPQHGLFAAPPPPQVLEPMDQVYRKPLPRGKMMAPSDVKFVVSKTLQPMESSDPYTEDFYYIQLNLKKNRKALEAAAQVNAAPPRLFVAPLPVWADTKTRIQAQLDNSRSSLADKTKQWEDKERVLGHTQRADISRPRAVLSVPLRGTGAAAAGLEDGEDAGAVGDAAEGDSYHQLFSSRLWTMRQAVQRGYEALHTVQELDQLLNTPVVFTNPIARDEVLFQIGKAIHLLSQSLGIRSGTEAASRNGAGLLGNAAASEISLDGSLVAAIMQTAKGKKLMSRSLNLIPPEQRWALVPVVLARVLQSNPTNHTTEDASVEKLLMKEIFEFVQFAHRHQQQQQHFHDAQESIRRAEQAVAVGAPHPSFEKQEDEEEAEDALATKTPAPFTLTLLSHLRQCVKSVMVSYMEKKQLRQALLSSRSRAEVMHVIVQVGDELAALADPTASEEWILMKEAFMCMLDG